jgi:hypothetical protein
VNAGPTAILAGIQSLVLARIRTGIHARIEIRFDADIQHEFTRIVCAITVYENHDRVTCRKTQSHLGARSQRRAIVIACQACSGANGANIKHRVEHRIASVEHEGPCRRCRPSHAHIRAGCIAARSRLMRRSGSRTRKHATAKLRRRSHRIDALVDDFRCGLARIDCGLARIDVGFAGVDAAIRAHRIHPGHRGRSFLTTRESHD